MDESEELPQILHTLVNDGPPALAGRNAQVRRRSVSGCFLHEALGGKESRFNE